MKNPAKTLQMVIRVLGLVVLVLGLVLFANKYHGNVSLYHFHEALAILLVLALWALCYYAAKARVAVPLVAAAVVWGLIAPILGFAQLHIDGGNSHPIEFLHLLVGLGIIAFGEVLGKRTSTSS